MRAYVYVLEPTCLRSISPERQDENRATHESIFLSLQTRFSSAREIRASRSELARSFKLFAVASSLAATNEQ